MRFVGLLKSLAQWFFPLLSPPSQQRWPYPPAGWCNARPF